MASPSSARRLRLVAVVGACLLLMAQTAPDWATGLRDSDPTCFDSAAGRQRVICEASDFAFPQAWVIEGRRVRLTTRQNEVRYLQRSDVHSAQLSAQPTPLPSTDSDTGGVIRANTDVANPPPPILDTSPVGIVNEWTMRVNDEALANPEAAEACGVSAPWTLLPASVSSSERLDREYAVAAQWRCLRSYARRDRQTLPTLPP